MPMLPLDHPEPFAATLGTMLYPGIDHADTLKARSAAAQWLAEPLKRNLDAGHVAPEATLVRIATECGQQLTDYAERWSGGLQTGELFATFFALAASHPRLASWSNAIKLMEIAAARSHTSGARTALWKVKRRFLTVAHLWGAWHLREGRFETRLELGYDDFRSFLTEAEILRDWGQVWRQPRSKSKPPLPDGVWRVPQNWEAVPKAAIRIPEIREEFLTELRPAGRPRRH